MVELSKFRGSVCLDKYNTASERDLARSMLAHVIEDLGYEVNTEVVYTSLTTQQRQHAELLRPVITELTLGIPSDVTININDLSNGFYCSFLF